MITDPTTKTMTKEEGISKSKTLLIIIIILQLLLICCVGSALIYTVLKVESDSNILDSIKEVLNLDSEEDTFFDTEEEESSEDEDIDSEEFTPSSYANCLAFRFDDEEYYVLTSLNGERDAQEIADRYNEKFKDELTGKDIHDFLSALAKKDIFERTRV